MKYFFLLFFIIFLSLPHAFSQSKSFLKAQHYFSNGNYRSALDNYEKAVKKEKKNLFYLSEIWFNMGECERILNDTIVEEYYHNSISYSKRGNEVARTKIQKFNNLRRRVLSHYYLKEYEFAAFLFERMQFMGILSEELAGYYFETLLILGKEGKAKSFYEQFINGTKMRINAANINIDSLNPYLHLDTINTFAVNLTSYNSDEKSEFWVYDELVDTLRYKVYERSINNLTLCRPCYLKIYSANDTLLREGYYYTDCVVGDWIEYYPSGHIKTKGHYKENHSGSWDNIFDRGFCSVKDGEWIYYNKEGNIIKTEQYINGELVE